VVLVDSPVLPDLSGGGGRWAAWSSRVHARAAETARIAINPVIYAEVSVRYSRIENLDPAPPPNHFGREPIPYQSALLAAKAFVRCRQRGGLRLSRCPGFFIGTHAAVASDRLLTRAGSRFRSFFPTPVLIAPDESRQT
jgi:hypothetical protein